MNVWAITLQAQSQTQSTWIGLQVHHMLALGKSYHGWIVDYLYDFWMILPPSDVHSTLFLLWK